MRLGSLGRFSETKFSFLLKVFTLLVQSGGHVLEHIWAVLRLLSRTPFKKLGQFTSPRLLATFAAQWWLPSKPREGAVLRRVELELIVCLQLHVCEC